MIPPTDEFGCLPPGVHPATMAEIEARFGRESELRRVQIDEYLRGIFARDRFGAPKGMIEVVP